MIKISVILTSYNEAEYLSQAINSCLNQDTQERFEIIIGDDGSSDESISIIKEYQEKYPDIIKYFVMERDESCRKDKLIPSIRVSKIINRGIRMSKGKYIVCLSGDDYFCDVHKFEIQSRMLDEDKGEECSACVSGYRYVNDRNSTWRDVKILRKSPMTMWANEYIHISCFMFRKAGYIREGLKYFCDDTGLVYTLSVWKGRWLYTDRVMFAYRQRYGSITHATNGLEQHILEVLLFENILQKPQKIVYSLSRYNNSLWIVWEKRKELGKISIGKYLELSSKMNHDILGDIYHYQEKTVYIKMRIILLLIGTKISHAFLTVLNRINSMIK